MTAPTGLSLEPYARNVRVAVHVKPPAFVLVLAGIINSNAGTRADLTGIQFPILDPKGVSQQVFAVQFFVDRHRLAELSRTTSNVDISDRVVSQPPHHLRIFQRLDGAN